MNLEVDGIAIGKHKLVLELIDATLLELHVQDSAANFEKILDPVVSCSCISFSVPVGIHFNVKLTLRLVNHFAESGRTWLIFRGDEVKAYHDINQIKLISANSLVESGISSHDVTELFIKFSEFPRVILNLW